MFKDFINLIPYKILLRYQFSGIPLTTKIKRKNYLYFKIKVKGKKSFACLTRMRVLDSKRLNNATSEVETSIFQQIITKINNLFSQIKSLFFSEDRWLTPVELKFIKLV